MGKISSAAAYGSLSTLQINFTPPWAAPMTRPWNVWIPRPSRLCTLPTRPALRATKALVWIPPRAVHQFCKEPLVQRRSSVPMRHAEPHLRIRRFRKPTGFYLARKGPPDMRRATYRIRNDPPCLLSRWRTPFRLRKQPSGPRRALQDPPVLHWSHTDFPRTRKCPTKHCGVTLSHCFPPSLRRPTRSTATPGHHRTMATVMTPRPLIVIRQPHLAPPTHRAHPERCLGTGHLRRRPRHG